MYRTLFPREMFADLNRLQREVSSFMDDSPSIRGLGRGGFPAVNVGSTPTSLEIVAFVPGIDPASIDVNLDRGVLSIAGERSLGLPGSDAKSTLHTNERFGGRFRRVLSLPEDIDPTAVTARCTDGVLHISVQRRETQQPRRIEVQ